MDVRLASPHSVNECRRRIVASFDGQLTFAATLGAPFAMRRRLLGRIDGDEITMRMSGPTSDSFPASRARYHPTFRGRIGSQGEGSVVTGSIADMSLYLRIFSILWLGTLILVALPVTLYAAATQLTTRPATLLGPVVAIVMIVGGWFLFGLIGRAWHQEVDRLVSVIADAIDAKVEDTAEVVR